MSAQMSKPMRVFFILTLLLCNTVVMCDCVFLPTVDGIYEHFSDAPTALIDLIVSVNYLVIMFSSLIAGKMAAKVGNKAVIIAGVLSGLAGTGFLIGNHPLIMAVMRIIYAGGYGFCQVGCVAMLNHTYTEPKKRAQMMSLYTAIQSLIGAVLSTVSGVLAVDSIARSYQLYWIYLPLLLLVILFVPHIKPEQPKSREVSSACAREKKPPFGSYYWISVICFAVSYFSAMWLSFYVSTYVAENGIGNAASAGTINALNTLGGCLGAILSSFLAKKLGRMLPVLSYLLIGIVVCTHYFIPVISVVYAVTLLRGFAFVSTLTWLLANLPTMVPAERSTLAVPIFTAAYGGLIFCAPYCVSFFKMVMGTEMFTPTLIVPTILCVGAVLLQYFSANRQPKEE